jgi:hypothetical protein
MDQIFKLADKFQRLVSQVVIQQDIGNAEKKVLAGSGIVYKILNYVKQYFAAKNMQPGNCSTKITLTINTDPKGNAISAIATQFEIYCQNIDLSFDLSDLNAKLLNEFGKSAADIMLKAYRTNPACRNVLKTQFASNPNQEQVVVISI